MIDTASTNNSTTAAADESILDLINSKIILSMTDNILTEKDIKTDTSITYQDNIVTVKGNNDTFSTKVDPEDTSKQGLLKERIDCMCGINVCKCALNRHLKSQKHQSYLNKEP